MHLSQDMLKYMTVRDTSPFHLTDLRPRALFPVCRLFVCWKSDLPAISSQSPNGKSEKNMTFYFGRLSKALVVQIYPDVFPS